MLCVMNCFNRFQSIFMRVQHSVDLVLNQLLETALKGYAQHFIRCSEWRVLSQVFKSLTRSFFANKYQECTFGNSHKTATDIDLVHTTQVNNAFCVF